MTATCLAQLESVWERESTRQSVTTGKKHRGPPLGQKPSADVERNPAVTWGEEKLWEHCPLLISTSLLLFSPILFSRPSSASSSVVDLSLKLLYTVVFFLVLVWFAAFIDPLFSFIFSFTVQPFYLLFLSGPSPAPSSRVCQSWFLFSLYVLYFCSFTLWLLGRSKERITSGDIIQVSRRTRFVTWWMPIQKLSSNLLFLSLVRLAGMSVLVYFILFFLQTQTALHDT